MRDTRNLWKGQNFFTKTSLFDMQTVQTVWTVKNVQFFPLQKLLWASEYPLNSDLLEPTLSPDPYLIHEDGRYQCFLFNVASSYKYKWTDQILFVLTTDYGLPPVMKSPSLHSQKFTPTPKVLVYGRCIFCLPHWHKFSDFFDLCLFWVSVVRGLDNVSRKNFWRIP